MQRRYIYPSLHSPWAVGEVQNNDKLLLYNIESYLFSLRYLT